MNKSVNLVIKSKADSLLIHKLKIILPILSILGIIIFIIVFLTTLFYLNKNIAEYELLKKEISDQEGKISTQKNLEGIYDIVALKTSVLEKILSQKKSFNQIINLVVGLQESQVAITSQKIDTKGQTDFSVIASSSAQLDDFINLILSREQKKEFSNIEAIGFLKNKKGSYSFNINLKSDPSLLK